MKDEVGLAATANVSGQANAPLDATAQFLTFDAGMYAVDFHAPRSAQSNAGLALPCARLDPMPPSPELEGRAFISMMADGGWLSHGDLPTFVRVVGGKAGVLLTIYKASGAMPSPELRIRYIRDDLQFPALPDISDEPPAEMPQTADGPKLQILVHAQERGDIRANGGEWAGKPGSRRLLEGFAITCDPDMGIGMEELEYQGILGDKWNTPWFAAGEFCGSRGMALPILGLRVRLTGHAAELYQCVYSASFVGRGEIGPISDGSACEGAGQPMDALRVTITRRAPTAAAASPEPVEPPGPKRRKTKK